MYLSQLILNPRSRQVRSEIADPYEMHRTVMHAFPAQLAGSERVLFRLEVHPHTGVPTLLVQSHGAPDWSFLLAPGKNYLLGEAGLPPDGENPAVKPVDLRLGAGQVLAFRLRANPTVKKDRPDEPERKQGRRVGLVREEDQLAWLRRKIEAAGAVLLSARTCNDARVNGKLFTGKEEGGRMQFLSVQFDGVVQVQDPPRFLEAVRAGIGNGKGLGFGLLSLARAAA